MTKTTLILGASLAMVFTLSMIMVPAFSGGHLAITETEVEVDDGELEAEIEVTADIPTDGSLGLFGYGIITDLATFNNVLAITTHAGAFDHSSQSSASDPIFHAHILDLAPAGTFGACSALTFDAVVDFASSLAAPVNNIDAQYEVEVDDEEIEIEDVPISDLADSSVDAIVAFTITGVGFDASAPVPLPFLCLDVVGLGVGL